MVFFFFFDDADVAFDVFGLEAAAVFFFDTIDFFFVEVVFFFDVVVFFLTGGFFVIVFFLEVFFFAAVFFETFFATAFFATAFFLLGVDDLEADAPGLVERDAAIVFFFLEDVRAFDDFFFIVPRRKERPFRPAS